MDCMKIDMVFLKMTDANYEKGVGIIESVVNMARLLDIPVVAEGVETERHREILQGIGCRYAQGYYYYRPMPAGEFYDLIKESTSRDKQGIVPQMVEYITISELVESQVLNQGMIDQILGPFSFFELECGKLHRMRINKAYYEMIQSLNSQPVKLGRKDDIMQWIQEEDRELLLQKMKEAKESPKKTSHMILRTNEWAKCVWMDITIYFLKELNQGDFYGARIQDITQQRIGESELENSQKDLYNAGYVAEENEYSLDKKSDRNEGE